MPLELITSDAIGRVALHEHCPAHGIIEVVSPLPLLAKAAGFFGAIRPSVTKDNVQIFDVSPGAYEIYCANGAFVKAAQPTQVTVASGERVTLDGIKAFGQGIGVLQVHVRDGGGRDTDQYTVAISTADESNAASYLGGYFGPHFSVPLPLGGYRVMLLDAATRLVSEHTVEIADGTRVVQLRLSL